MQPAASSASRIQRAVFGSISRHWQSLSWTQTAPAELLFIVNVEFMKVTLLAANAMAALPNDCSPAKLEFLMTMSTPRNVMVLPGSCVFWT